MKENRIGCVIPLWKTRGFGIFIFMNAVDKKAEKTLADYCARYKINRQFNSPEIPSLLVATMSGTGREVYNRDGGGVIAEFSSTDVARKTIHKLIGVWVNY